MPISEAVSQISYATCDAAMQGDGEFAKVTAEGQDFTHLEWTVSECCESLRQEAMQVFKS
jgi:hypothetical protein